MSEDRVPADEPLEERLSSMVRSLPRERAASGVLEERTVSVLRARGLLSGGRRGLPRAWLAAAMAASVALFACGVVTGQWLHGRQTAALLAAQQRAPLNETARLVAQTGTAYVSAMARLAETNSVPGSAETREARETALQILHLAANEVVRLAPNDPVAVKILQGFDHAALERLPVETRGRRRQIVWF